MKQALGLVEIEGLTTAVVVADTMAKAANVQILELENTKGLGYMTIKIAGDVGAVNAAVTAGKQIGMLNQKLISWKVIPRPSDYVERTFCDPQPPEPASPPEQQEISEPETGLEEEMIPQAEPEPAAEPAEEPVTEPEPAADTETESEPSPEPEPESKPESKAPAAKKSKSTKGKK